jgi:hypothetical protein
MNKYFIIKKYYATPGKSNPKVSQRSDAFPSLCSDRGGMFELKVAAHSIERTIPGATNYWALIRPMWADYFMCYYIIHWKCHVAAKGMVFTWATYLTHYFLQCMISDIQKCCSADWATVHLYFTLLARTMTIRAHHYGWLKIFQAYRTFKFP